MFRPPICRGMRNLDRAFFQKTIALKAARVLDSKNISKVRTELVRSKDALQAERLACVFPDPDVDYARVGGKCVVLRPEFKSNTSSNLANGNAPFSMVDNAKDKEPWPHSEILSRLEQEKIISIIPYDLELDYAYWTYHDIISAILPEELLDEIPSGFSQVGHVAHLNLREPYYPYKNLIAEIIVDKNPGVRSVINKIDDVGEESEYRTFRYELIAGLDDMRVEVSEENCTFRFDYSKVYWNTRLQTEHTRLVSKFKPGEAVCDVMAGVGPFAVPAGKKGVFVWANDLNPDSYASLVEAIKSNNVKEYVQPSNEDGRTFIRSAAVQLLNADVEVVRKRRKNKKDTLGMDKPSSKALSPPEAIRQPKTFQHYILNLPATALTFLPSFVGLYDSKMRSLLPDSGLMPIVHVYCFSTKDELSDVAEDNAEQKICAEICKQLICDLKPGKIEEGGIEVYDVRDVSPKKRMFCASFRLPEEVAFRGND